MFRTEGGVGNGKYARWAEVRLCRGMPLSLSLSGIRDACTGPHIHPSTVVQSCKSLHSLGILLFISTTILRNHSTVEPNSLT